MLRHHIDVRHQPRHRDRLPVGLVIAREDDWPVRNILEAVQTEAHSDDITRTVYETCRPEAQQPSDLLRLTRPLQVTNDYGAEPGGNNQHIKGEYPLP